MTCRICGNQKNNTEYEAQEMMFGIRERFTYFQCAACQCLQIAEFPPNIIDYYPPNYHSFESPESLTKYYSSFGWKVKKTRYKAALYTQSAFDKLIASAFPLPSQYDLLRGLHISPSTRLLDVGCGTGYYIYPLYELGMQQILGIDPFIKAPIKYPNGLQIDKKYIFNVTGLWDIIIYNHSFEHLPDPLENLQAVSQLLTKGGYCVLRIPTVSSYAWEHYRTNWYQLDAPRHFFLHSLKSIQLLAEKAAMELTDVIYDSGAMQFLGSEKYIRNIASVTKEPRTLSSWLQKKWKKRKYNNMARQLNHERRGDQAAFILKKN